MADRLGGEDMKIVGRTSFMVSLAGAIVVLAVAKVIVKIAFNPAPKLNLPPGPIELPLVGTIFHTRGPKAHKILSNLAKKYGPIFALRTGSRYFIVVTSADITHEALHGKNQQNFSSRPKLLSSLNYRGFRSVTSSPCGPYWRAARRNLVIQVHGTKQVASFAPFREEALDALITGIKSEADRNDAVVSVLSHCRLTMLSILLHVCFGMKFGESAIEELDQILKRLLVIMWMTPQIIDFLPFLQPFFSKKHKEEFRALLRRVEEIFGPIIEQHRKARRRGESVGDYVDSLLALQGEETGLKLVETHFLGLLGEMLIAGADTTANTLEWTVAHLIHYPDIQTKVYDEIKSVVAENRAVSEADIEKMPYLQAVVKETLRKHPPLPFGVVHGVSAQCKLRSYDIPKDALFLYHIQAIQNDPEHWKNPDWFDPERFLEPNSNAVEGIHFIPFGAGRRSCPGMNLGLTNAHLILGRLLQNFEFYHSDPGKDVDFDERFEFTLVMSTPLKARIRERDVSGDGLAL